MFPAFHCGSCSFKFLQRSHVAVSGGEDGDALGGGSLGWVFEHHWMGMSRPSSCSITPMSSGGGRRGPARPPGAMSLWGGLRRGDRGRINPEGS